MANIFKTKTFYAWFIIFLGLFYYIFSWTAFSGLLGVWTANQNISLWTAYSQKSDIDNTTLWLTVANLKLWLWEYSAQLYFAKALEYIISADVLIQSDTIQLLEDAVNKSAILEAHIKQMELLLQNIQDISASLDEVYNENQVQAQQCQQDKTLWDNNFFQGLKQNEQDLMNDGLDTSLENWPCYEKYRITANAYHYLNDKLKYYMNILQTKHDLILNNQELILKNFTLFKDSQLETLIKIRDSINSYNFETQ